MAYSDVIIRQCGPRDADSDNDLRILWRMLKMMKTGFIRYLLAIIFMSAALSVFDMITALLFKNIIFRVENYAQRNMFAGLLKEVLLCAGIGCLMLFIYALSFYVYTMEAKKGGADLQKALYSKCMRLPYSYYEQTGSSEFMSKVINDCERAQGIYGSRFRRVLMPFLMMSFYLTAMLMLSWQVTLCLFGASAILLVINGLFIEPMQRVSWEMSTINVSIAERISNILSGIEQIKIFSLKSVMVEQYIKENEKSFDLLISSEVFSFQSLLAARICPEKTIIWQELTDHQNKFHRLPSKIWHNVIVRLFMQRIAAVAPRSRPAYKFISKYMPQTVKQIVDHGINVDKFTYSEKKERQIISSSQLIHRKNIDGIIRIFQQFHEMEAYEDIKLLIAGRGEEEANLKKLVSELKLSESVRFLGFLPQQTLNKYIRESLCFLINTRKDLNMVSIPESIVSGTPILTNTQPASAGYIQANKLGIAKNQWGVDELKEIIDNNSFYVKNCIGYRDNLTNVHSAQLLTDIYKKSIQKQ